MKPKSDQTYSAVHALVRRRSNRRPWLTSAIVLLLVAQVPVLAMNRWAALSQIESGNNDYAIGTVGEISRYQIRPEVWVHYAGRNTDWQVPANALAVAKKVMQARCADFQKKFQRSPNDFEFYLLWNAPGQVQCPGPVVRLRAKRFCRIVQKVESGTLLTSR